jgi:hypothetical protein
MVKTMWSKLKKVLGADNVIEVIGTIVALIVLVAGIITLIATIVFLVQDGRAKANQTEDVNGVVFTLPKTVSETTGTTFISEKAYVIDAEQYSVIVVSDEYRFTNDEKAGLGFGDAAAAERILTAMFDTVFGADRTVALEENDKASAKITWNKNGRYTYTAVSTTGTTRALFDTKRGIAAVAQAVVRGGAVDSDIMNFPNTLSFR